MIAFLKSHLTRELIVIWNKYVSHLKARVVIDSKSILNVDTPRTQRNDSTHLRFPNASMKEDLENMGQILNFPKRDTRTML
jgi:uncharacterized protein YdeI (YjbR/CyaY-like superfamily)